MASPNGTKNYRLLETFISGWVERMSDMIIHVLKYSTHRNDLGLHPPPGNKHVDALKKMLFQKYVRGSPSRWEYTIFPGTGSHMRLGGFFKQWDPATVASAMFDHKNKPFSGAIHEKCFYSKKGAKDSPPAAIFILSQILLWSRFCKEVHSHPIKLVSTYNTKYLQIQTGNCLDALRWTMNFYHNVIDSVHYSYPIWKKCYFVVDPRYPIQNHPQEVIHLCLLGSAIKTCSEFFKNLTVKASWRLNSSWETALDALSSSNTERFKAAPNMDTYLTISHSFQMELGSKSDKKEYLKGTLST